VQYPAASCVASRHVQDAVPEVGDLAGGELGLVIEADQLRPANEVDDREQALEPGRVRAIFVRLRRPRRLGLANAVLDRGVLAVLELEARDRAGIAWRLRRGGQMKAVWL
jgi:hypothetical protein